MSEEKAIQRYIDEKKELQNLVLQIIDEPESEEDTVIQKLNKFLEVHHYENNKSELEHFLHLISTISVNHHRTPNFFEKIEKILTISSEFYKSIFSNEELFTIFQESQPILLFLLRSKIILIDQIIFELLTKYQINIGGEITYYFYPELESIIKTGTINNIKEEDIKIQNQEYKENFETNRHQFENDSELCSMIREDLIEEFIQYVHKNNISLKSSIKRSIFETNSIFIEKEPTLIEYAAFFGSIQIMKYLEINEAEMTGSIWLYAVHSNNSEVIQLLEDKNIDIDDKTFSEAIKCHHNDMAHYIYNNYLDNSSNITELNDCDLSSIYSSSNYEFFSYEIDENKIFFNLCKNKYETIINLYLSTKKKEIEKYLSEKNKTDVKKIISEALEANKLDIAYHLLLSFDSIPSKYFYELKSITKIALPNTIKSIMNHAFYNCSKLIQIVIPSSVTSIGEFAFCGCLSLTQITFTIPSSVTSIGNCAFYECSSLTQISIPSSVTSIGNHAFKGCSSLTQITIPSSVTSIGNYAFFECSSLAQITIPSSVTSIGNYAFFGCSSLAQITIPSFVTSIGHSTFFGCSSLTQITIPSSLNSIYGSAFYSCSKLDKIIIHRNGEERIQYFEDTFLIFKSNQESEIFDTLLWIKRTITTANIPQFIKIIGDYAFSGCSSLTQITIPSSVTSIRDSAFSECSSLTQITFTSPSSVASIGYSAFFGCSSLTQITIPSSVASIGDSAFSECSSLTQIAFTSPSSVASIGYSAFSGCSSLIQITIPSSVASIGDSAFSGCSSLKQITIPSSIVRYNLNIPSKTKVTEIREKKDEFNKRYIDN